MRFIHCVVCSKARLRPLYVGRLRADRFRDRSCLKRKSDKTSGRTELVVRLRSMLRSLKWTFGLISNGLDEFLTNRFDK